MCFFFAEQVKLFINQQSIAKSDSSKTSNKKLKANSLDKDSNLFETIGSLHHNHRQDEIHSYNKTLILEIPEENEPQTNSNFHQTSKNQIK